MGMNITRINKLQPDAEPGHRNILVKCYCTDDDQEKLKSTLEKYHAQNVKITLKEMDEQHCNCVVTYSVWDEKGSLHNSIQAFEVQTIIIIILLLLCCMHDNLILIIRFVLAI